MRANDDTSPAEDELPLRIAEAVRVMRAGGG
jgi:hypothetical protein